MLPPGPRPKLGEPAVLSGPWRASSSPGERHWEILQKMMRDGQVTGPLVTDSVVAAIAIEHGATLCTTDRDFSRFHDLKWTKPLADAADKS